MKEAKLKLYEAVLNKDAWSKQEDHWIHPAGVHAMIVRSKEVFLKIQDATGYPIQTDKTDCMISMRPVLHFQRLASIVLEHADGHIPDIIDLSMGPKAWNMLDALFYQLNRCHGSNVHRWYKNDEDKTEYILLPKGSKALPIKHHIFPFLKPIRLFNQIHEEEIKAPKICCCIPDQTRSNHRQIETIVDLQTWSEQAIQAGLVQKSIKTHAFLKL